MTEIIRIDQLEGGLDEDPVVRRETKEFRSDHWCPDCGNQFKDRFTVSGELRASGKGEIHMEGCQCPQCGSERTRPHVQPGTVHTSDSELVHIMGAVRYAGDQNPLQTRVSKAVRKVTGFLTG